MPLYSYSLAGIILEPAYNKVRSKSRLTLPILRSDPICIHPTSPQVRCAYAFDAGSIKWHDACNPQRCWDMESADGHATSGWAHSRSQDTCHSYSAPVSTLILSDLSCARPSRQVLVQPDWVGANASHSAGVVPTSDSNPSRLSHSILLSCHRHIPAMPRRSNPCRIFAGAM